MNHSDLQIPIEENQELLIEYGRAFAWINMVEMQIEFLIVLGGNPSPPTIDVKELESIRNKVLGTKIKLLNTIPNISPTLITDLNKLNDKRVILAHGVTGKGVTTKNGQVIQSWHNITHKGTKYKLTPTFLTDITEQSKKILFKLISNSYYKK